MMKLHHIGIACDKIFENRRVAFLSTQLGLIELLEAHKE